MTSEIIKPGPLLLLVVVLAPLVVTAFFPEHADQDAREAVTLNYTIVDPIDETPGTVRFDWKCEPAAACGTQRNDWISLWASGSNFTFVRYVNATTPKSAPGGVTFKLVNIPEQSYFLRYFRGDEVLKTAGPIEPVRHVPSEFRLTTLSDDPKEITISWTTDRYVSGQSACVVGAGPGKFGVPLYAAWDNHSTYTQKDFLIRNNLPLDWPVADRPMPNISQRRIFSHCVNGECFSPDTAASYYSTPGVFLSVKVPNLAPGVSIEYKCGELNGTMSTSKFFTPRAAVGNFSQSQRKLIWTADMGTGWGDDADPWGGSVMGGVNYQNPVSETNRAAYVLEAIATKMTQHGGPMDLGMLILGGDLSYCRGHQSPCWAMFQHLGEKIFSSTSIVAVGGNHDIDFLYDSSPVTHGSDSAGEAGIVLSRRFNVDLNKQYYVRTMGAITFIVLDSENSNCAMQVQWLRAEILPILAAERDMRPWVVFGMHRPPLRHFNEDTQTYFTSCFEDVFDEWADVVIFGHDHFYGRRVPLMSLHVPNPAVCSSGNQTTTRKSPEFGQQCRVSFRVLPQNGVRKTKQSECYLGAPVQVDASVDGRDLCRAACAQNTNCQGFEVNKVPTNATAWQCQFLKCNVDGGVNIEPDNSVVGISGMKRHHRAAPVTICDGSSGQSFETAQFPLDPRFATGGLHQCERGSPTQECRKFGWTEFAGNATTLVVEHINYLQPDGPPVDRLVLTL